MIPHPRPAEAWNSAEAYEPYVGRWSRLVARDFLGVQGPVPTYTMSSSEDRRIALRQRIRSRLPVCPDGSIHLTARAWGVRGRLTALTSSL